MKLSASLLVALAATATAAVDERHITDALVKEINLKSTTWEAAIQPRFANSTTRDITHMMGTILKHHADYKPIVSSGEPLLLNDEDIPDSFDSRTAWSQCKTIGGIRDQSSCGSCWAFGSTEAFNDRLCVATNFTGILSTEDTVGCCSWLECFSFGCNGGQPGWAWSFFKNHGIVTGGLYGDTDTTQCLPYSLAPCAHHVPPTAKYPACPTSEYSTPSCASSCSVKGFPGTFNNDKHYAKSSYDISGEKQMQSEIMTYGPITGAFTVYGDFPAYKSGVYQHVSGSELGGHAIKIIGWGVENGNKYWTVVNSWNEEWGDAGTFKILRGNDECGIESQCSAGHV